MSELPRPDPFAPARLGPLTLRNRIIKAATFESLSSDEGLVTDRLVEFHRRPAAGGVGMTTVAYLAVSPEGRTYAHQIWLRDEAVPGLRRLTDAVHHEGAAAQAQIGHAGWFANPRATGAPNFGPSRKFSPYALRFSKAMAAADFDGLTRAFATSARRCVDAGFDAVEVHVGHGYLLSQFLSPWTNRRRDEWGGSIENRARFPRQVLRAVREAVGTSAAVTAKLNMEDGFDGGLTLDDSIAFAGMLEADGSVDAVQLTGGFTGRNPMYLMRGDVPLKEMLELEPDRLRRLGLRVVGRRFMTEIPFDEAYFLPLARRVRAAVKVPLTLLGGVTRLETIRNAIEDEGFDFVAMARALLREPDLVHRMREGRATAAACVPCNRCVTEIERDGTRCVFVSEPHGNDETTAR